MALTRSCYLMIIFLQRRRFGSFMNSLMMLCVSLLGTVAVFSSGRTVVLNMIALGCHHSLFSTTIMSQISPKSTANPLPPSSHPPNDTHSGDESGDQGTSDSLEDPRSRRVLDNLPDFSYDIDEQSKDPLDSWPEEVEIKPRRRSTLISSLIRGNQSHRSFFGDSVKDRDDDDGSEGTAGLKRRASKPLNDARRLSKTAVSALKERVPAVPWKPKRSPSQSANSRARA
jgi:hypothetical protein